ncbi:MAG: DUF4105 domain-containing protein [Gammaproteobacteria bacterium]|nr:MAG: DUF4105 domain-containing protein [Gammaproteobacteria bacterium]
MRLPPTILPLLIWAFSATVTAGTHQTSYIEELQERAADKVLWRNQEWMNLGHYRASGLVQKGFTSSVDDAHFFYAPDGKTSPQHELDATLAALFATQDTGNEHALCRFPARFNWLEKHLQIDTGRLPAVNCSDYAEWRGLVHANSVTMVFPTYQLNSPSSMFGHTLLRLDPADDENWSDWLSYAVNFGANITDGDNSMSYAWKGLTGGYPGQFIVMPYFKKIQKYNQIEKRDIWEYRLNLNPAEVDAMVTHLWELKEINFDYYFFTENCSYRLLELLEVARPGIELTDEFVVTAIPVDTVRTVERAGFVGGTFFRPSQQTIAKKMIGDLPEDDYVRLEKLLDQPIDEHNPDFQSIPAARQKLLLETTYKLLRLRQNRKVRDPLVAKKSYRLLAMLNRYPPGKAQEITAPVRPESGHHSKRVTFGALERRGKAWTELGFRMSYHSLEDNESGYLRGAQINIANIVLRRKNSSGTVVVQQADFADIFSLTPRSRFFKPISWRVRGGLERVYSDDQDRPVAHISGGGGYSWPLLNDGAVYTLLTGRLEANSTFDTWIEPALGAAAGGLYHSTIGTGRAEFNAEQFAGGEYRLKFSFIQNLVLSRDNALSFNFKREWHDDRDFNEIGLSYNHFF